MQSINFPFLELNKRDHHFFQICMKCITILRYLCDHIDELPLGVSTRLTITHDVPVLLVQLMATKPWIKTSKNQVFEGATWKVIQIKIF